MVKVQLSLSMSWKRMGEQKSSALDGGVWSTHTPAALTLGKELQYSFNSTLGGLQSRSGRFGEETRLFASTRLRIPDRPARSLVTILTELSQLTRIR
jgi:hypothetical protein